VNSQQQQLVIFIGPPGCGKGSLSQVCVRELGWVQLSTGYLCRKHIAQATDIGKQIDFSIKSGNLVSDELIVAMVEQWLGENIQEQKGVILDGFPRTTTQAQSLQKLVQERLKNCDVKVVQLSASDDVIIERISGRFVCENKECQAVYSVHAASALTPKQNNICDICASKLVRRTDDEEITIRKRLTTYYGYEQSLVNFYQRQGQQVEKINVEKPLNKVFEDFTKIIAD
jgi:adenylate kinase